MARQFDDLTIAFVGGGNMATAIIRGLIGAGMASDRILVFEPDEDRASALERNFSIGLRASNEDAVVDADVVVLAIKPQVMAEVLAELRAHISPRHLVVSIAAGQDSRAIEAGLGKGARVVRVMPNTPCLVASGVSVICPGTRAASADIELVVSLFATVGDVHTIEDETLMDAVTGLSGSGPAYVYRFAEALEQGGVAAGLDPKLARTLTFSTLRGAAEMMIQTGEEPAELRRAVSSPGGTTLEGLKHMDEAGFVEAAAGAVGAATRRSRELGKQS